MSRAIAVRPVGPLTTPAANAAWVWVPETEPPDAEALARFARARGIREAFVSVPWHGPTDAVRATTAALTAHGVRVSALGGDVGWARDPALAQAWARRALVEPRFTGVHLDIEPWTLPDWPEQAGPLLAGLARAVAAVVRSTGLPVAVDLTPGLARTHRSGFVSVARAATSVTVMSYRDTASAILEFSAEARRALRSTGRDYRLAVDTLPSGDAHTTFFGQAAGDLARETGTVAESLAADARFSGLAVHDLRGWMSLA
ncbi:MAG TPA: hypothetical protein VK045_13145 [Ornithinicoccus sp.]|nr:hypothetical protein [Ornithinicoccus sp.]